MEYYVQCKLKKGNTTVVTYITEDGADVGKSMLLKGEGKDRWLVVEVYKASKQLKAEVLSKRHNVFDSIK